MPAPIVNVRQAKTHLSELLRRVERGEEIVIARAGRPIAVLAPISPKPRSARAPGHERIAISADFDAPLPEFTEL